MHDELFEKLDIVARYRAGPDARSRQNAQGVRELVPESRMSWSSCARCSLTDMWRRTSQFHRAPKWNRLCATYWSAPHTQRLYSAREWERECGAHSAPQRLYTSLLPVKTGPLGPPKAWS
jgi:hypothetical protein